MCLVGSALLRADCLASHALVAVIRTGAIISGGVNIQQKYREVEGYQHTLAERLPARVFLTFRLFIRRSVLAHVGKIEQLAVNSLFA